MILDAALLKIPVKECAKSLVDAGVRLIQYRNKRATGRELFEKSLPDLAEYLNPIGVHFIVNDRADVSALAGAGGVHVGQDDLGVEQARRVMSEGGNGWVISTAHPGNRGAAGNISGVHRGRTRFCDGLRKGDPDPSVGVWGL